MDTSRSSMLTPVMLKAFVNCHQMEMIDEECATRLIQVNANFFFLLDHIFVVALTKLRDLLK